MKPVIPDPIVWPVSDDPLHMTDRAKNTIGHALRDSWRPCAAFLVGTGPSLRELDLELLRQRGVSSLGINNAAAIAPVSAMTFSDRPEKFHHGIFFDTKIIKFVPTSKLGKRVRAKLPDGSFQYTRFRACDCPSVFGYHAKATLRPEEFLTTDYASLGNNRRGVKSTGRAKIIFTMFLGLRLLCYLGVRRIYLIGVDFGMSYVDQYAFGNEHPDEFVNGNNDYYLTANSLMHELKPVLLAAGIEVFNCNPQSRLDAFEHVPYLSAVADCRSLVPDEPLDCSRYYDKGLV